MPTYPSKPIKLPWPSVLVVWAVHGSCWHREHGPCFKDCRSDEWILMHRIYFDVRVPKNMSLLV